MSWIVITNLPFPHRCHFNKKDRSSSKELTDLILKKPRNAKKCSITCKCTVRFVYCNFNMKKRTSPICISSSSNDYLHTCGLSTITQQKAIQSSGRSQPDVEGMKQVILLLHNSHLDNCTLSNYLCKYVHTFIDINDQWLRNVRKTFFSFF